MSSVPAYRATIVGASAILAISAIAVGGPASIASGGPEAGSTTTDAASVGAVEKKLSHFLCYGGKLGGFRDGATAPEVELRSITSPPATVGPSRTFCNPVEKKKGRKVLARIASERHHLKGYSLETPIIGTDLGFGVSNQFVSDDLIRFDLRPFALLVPTRKFPHQFPSGLDHFLCYPVQGGTSVDRRFKLVDQFHRHKRMLVSNPVAFCAPTTKVHGSKEFTPRHPEAHLTCYIVSSRRLDPKRKRRASNQFEKRERITVKRTGSLCVPTIVIRA